MAFPGDTVDGSSPADAGDTSSIPGPGGFHMHRATMPMCHNYWAHVLQLSKPVHLEPVLYRRSQGNETPHALQPESSPRLPQQEKALGQQQRPQAAKNQINNFVKVVKT